MFVEAVVEEELSVEDGLLLEEAIESLNQKNVDHRLANNMIIFCTSTFGILYHHVKIDASAQAPFTIVLTKANKKICCLPFKECETAMSFIKFLQN